MSYANNHGVRIHLEVEGEGDPILLHHGFSDSLASWAENGWLHALKGRYQVIRMDARGHGQSDKPRDPDAYGMAQRVGDVLAVLDHLGIEAAHYAGYSLGGRVGWELAGTHQDRVRSVILGGAHPFAQSMEPYRLGMFHGAKAWVGLIEQRAGPLPEGTRARLLENDAAALSASVARDRPDRSELLERVRAPTLLFCGAEDELRPEIERAAFSLPHAHLLQVTGYDHLKLAAHLEAVLPTVQRFLDLASSHQVRVVPSM